MARIKPGDIFEIKTPKGKVYLHYVYKDKVIGELIRVLPGLYSERPFNFKDVASKKEMYLVSFALSFAYKRNIVELVGHYSLPDFQKPKYMRTEHAVQGEFLGWHIVNTETWERKLIKELTEEQKRLSPWGVWNDTLLIERLTQGWTLDSWV